MSLGRSVNDAAKRIFQPDVDHRVALQLPRDDPYFQLAFSSQPDKLISASLATRIDLALSDPAFLWNLAESHATRGLPLPTANLPCAVRRAYAFLLDAKRSDINVELAQELNSPENQEERDIIRAVLLCQDMTMEELAMRCGKNLEVLALFEALFWNCRGRCKERIYRAQLCQQAGFRRATGGEQDSNNLGQELLTIAYNSGSIELVLAAAHVAAVPAKGDALRMQYQQLGDRVMASVLMKLRSGSVNKSENPLLEPVLRIMNANKEALRVEKTTEGPTIPESIQLVFEQIRRPDPRFPKASAHEAQRPPPGDADLQEAPPQQKTQNKTDQV